MHETALLAGLVKVNRSITSLNLTNNQLCGSALFEKVNNIPPAPTPKGKASAGKATKATSIKQSMRRQRSKKIMPSKSKNQRNDDPQTSAAARQQDLSGLKVTLEVGLT